MKKKIFSILSIPLLLFAGCVYSDSTTLYANDVAEVCCKPFLLAALDKNKISLEQQNDIWEIVQPQLVLYLQQEMTQQELKEILTIYGSPKMYAVLKRISTDSVTEDDAILLQQIYDSSSGFQKFTSKKFSLGIKEILIECEKKIEK